jgi:hypothetical protein
MALDGSQSNEVGDALNEGHLDNLIEVDSARLLLILCEFSTPVTPEIANEVWYPRHPVVRHFTPEYYLHKLDFLLRYPGYVAYELTELHRLEFPVAQERSVVMKMVRDLLKEREPELLTLPFRRFWRGAYERLDGVEAWWYSRALVYTTSEARGAAPRQKHYFLSAQGVQIGSELVKQVEHAKWYAERIHLLHHYFGDFTPSELKAMQYKHEPYRQAQLNESIPDLELKVIVQHFEDVFQEKLGVQLDW